MAGSIVVLYCSFCFCFFFPFKFGAISPFALFHHCVCEYKLHVVLHRIATGLLRDCGISCVYSLVFWVTYITQVRVLVNILFVILIYSISEKTYLQNLLRRCKTTTSCSEPKPCFTIWPTLGHIHIYFCSSMICSLRKFWNSCCRQHTVLWNKVLMISNIHKMYKLITICSNFDFYIIMKIHITLFWAKHFLQDCMCTHWRHRPACASAHSDQSSQGTPWVVKDPKSSSVQRRLRMCRLIWEFTMRTCNFIGNTMPRLHLE